MNYFNKLLLLAAILFFAISLPIRLISNVYLESITHKKFIEIVNLLESIPLVSDIKVEQQTVCFISIDFNYTNASDANLLLKKIISMSHDVELSVNIKLKTKTDNGDDCISRTFGSRDYYWKITNWGNSALFFSSIILAFSLIVSLYNYIWRVEIRYKIFSIYVIILSPFISGWFFALIIEYSPSQTFAKFGPTNFWVIPLVFISCFCLFIYCLRLWVNGFHRLITSIGLITSFLSMSLWGINFVIQAMLRINILMNLASKLF